MSGTARTCAVVMLGVGLLIASLVMRGYIGSSATRIEREHGLRLPSSAKSFVCRGDAWMHVFNDSDAASTFVMDSDDLAQFTSQLQACDVHRGQTGFPMDARHEIKRPWMSSEAIQTYRCRSATGSELDAQIWRIDDAHIGVLLYTDWN